MLEKRGASGTSFCRKRKGQVISSDFIVAFILFTVAFSIFSYYIFAIQDKAFSQRSFLKDTYYNFDIFEKNLAEEGYDAISDYRLASNISEVLEDISYEKLKGIIFNGTQFEGYMGEMEACMYLTDSSEIARFHNGPDDEDVSLSGLACGGPAEITSPFPSCEGIYTKGFSATRIYYSKETDRTSRL